MRYWCFFDIGVCILNIDMLLKIRDFAGSARATFPIQCNRGPLQPLPFSAITSSYPSTSHTQNHASRPFRMHARSVVRAWGLVAPRAGPSTAFARTLSSSAGTYNAPMNAMGKVLDQIAVDKSSSLTRAEPPKTPADAAAVEGRPTTPNQDANTTAGTAESETAGVKTGLPRRGRVGTPGYAPDVRPPVVDPVIDLFINMIMLHGKKSQARKEMSNILENM